MQLPQSSTIGTTESLKNRIVTFFRSRVPGSGLAASNGIMILLIGSYKDTYTGKNGFMGQLLIVVQLWTVMQISQNTRQPEERT